MADSVLNITYHRKVSNEVLGICQSLLYQKYHVEWFLLRFANLVRDIRISPDLDRFLSTT